MVEQVTHHDCLLRPINIGDHVVHGARLTIHRVERLTDKMIACIRVGGKKTSTKPTHYYGHDVVLVPSEDVVLFLLKEKK